MMRAKCGVRRGVNCAMGLAVISAAALAVGGCDSKPRMSSPRLNGRDTVIVPSLYPALKDSVAQFAIFLDSAPLYVEGYGVVAELPGTGSGQMPPAIHELLLESLEKAGAGSYSRGTQDIDPEKILNSNYIAAVEIRGVIPPLARKGSSFDLVVSCLPNSEATSLSGGLLWTSELKISAQIGNDTKAIAMGRGPVFLPAAVDAVSGENTSRQMGNQMHAVRVGRVIAGGRVMEDRDVRLQLYNPSFATAAAIERAINSRFPGQDKAASADSDSIISLHIPPEYDSNPMEFIEIVKHMFLVQENPGFSEGKARELVEAMKDPAAPQKDLSLALQALGRSILPDFIQTQYTNPDPRVRFWCARAGAGLNDVGGMVVLQDFAKEKNSPYQKDAVAAITEFSRGRDTMRATETLVGMLHSKNVADRIAGYEGLVAINSPAVESVSVGRKFWLDIVDVDSNDPPLIFVTQVGVPRIALIGKSVHMSAGMLYVSKDNALTVSVPEAEAEGNMKNVTAKTEGMTLVMGSSNATLDHQSRYGEVKGAGLDGAVGKAASTQPALAKPVTLYWVSPTGAREPIEVKAPVILSHVIARLGWIPDPRLPKDPSDPYIGASFQRIVEMLAGMTRDQLIDAEFAMQNLPKDAVRSPTDIINSSRPEGFAEAEPAVKPEAPATTAPAVDSGGGVVSPRQPDEAAPRMQ